MTDGGVLGVYEVSAASLEAIASGTPGLGDLLQLKSVETSMQRLLWRSIFERISEMSDDRYGRLDPPTLAWQLLSEVYEAAPEAVEAVTADPFLRAWAVGLLRRLDGAESEPRSPDGPIATQRSPFWVEIAQLHAVAAAAAIRAGFSATIKVATSAGRVWLPTLGVASSLDSCSWGVAEVYSSPVGGIVRGADRRVSTATATEHIDPHWQPLLKAPDDLQLDGVTPYRDFGYELQSAADLREESSEWQNRLKAAVDLLEARLPDDRALVSAMVRTIVPLSPPPLDPLAVASASAPDAFGAVAMSLPLDAAHTAASLVHEARHQELNALLLLTPLVEERDAHGRDDTAVHYAPWRSDPRPALGLCHGVFAFAGVAAFWRAQRQFAVDERDALRAHFEYAVLREQVGEGIAGLISSGRLTAPGEIFARALSRTVQLWCPEFVPETPARLARSMCEGRRAVWRLRHLALETDDARSLAQAWRSGGGTPTEVRSVPCPRPELVRPDRRGSLSRLYLSSPEVFAADRLRASSETAAQMDVIVGDGAQARHWYRERISEEPSAGESWIAWAGSWQHHERPPAARLLLERPEVVEGVYCRLTDDGEFLEPLALAEWLATAVPSLRDATCPPGD
ncbi:aKG-HExxH-type peptide beta-hydroxylase [Streptomyces sp. NPDC059272]|uniref:aKG-HExxH-type peptide beta-hydroxylase n=1 Tax=Streptomyces sp. NPDC059272 TaxID=3346800 RepID=UPI0036C271CF